MALVSDPGGDGRPRPSLPSAGAGSIGACVALAYPDRLSRRRSPSGVDLISVGGRGFRLDPAVANPAHRAGPDAWVTAHILMDLLAEHPVEQLIAWTAEPRRLDRIPFGKHRGRPWSEAPDDYLRWMAGQGDMDAEVVAAARQELTRRSGLLAETPDAG